MEDGEKHRAFEREAVFARPGEIFDNPPATRLLPQSFEHESGPDPAGGTGDNIALGEGADDHGLGGEARARSQQPLQLPALAQILDAAEGGDHLLADLRAVAAAFDDLEVGAPARGLLAKVHDAAPCAESNRGPHIIVAVVSKIKPSLRKRGTTFSRQPPARFNDINGLSRCTALQL